MSKLQDKSQNYEIRDSNSQFMWEQQQLPHDFSTASSDYFKCSFTTDEMPHLLADLL